jgi:hypothetical protein
MIAQLAIDFAAPCPHPDAHNGMHLVEVDGGCACMTRVADRLDVVVLGACPAASWGELIERVLARISDADVCAVDAAAARLGVEQGPARARYYARGPT